MTLSCSKQFNANSRGPGIYVNQATIVSAEDISGKPVPYLDNPFDIGMKLTLNIGKDFQPELVIAGSFKRDPVNGDIIGWGSAFVVQEAMARLGYTGLLEEGNRIPVDALDDCVGQTILRLSYVSAVKDSGKFRYSDWNQIATLDEGAENLVQRFRRSLTRGYPKNYRPELLDTLPKRETLAPVTEQDPF